MPSAQERQTKIWEMKANLKKGTDTCTQPVTQESPGRFTWQTVCVSPLISQLSIAVISSMQRENRRTAPRLLGEEVPWKQMMPKTHRCLKSTLSTTSPRHRLWAGRWAQYGSGWRHADSTQPLLPCFRYQIRPNLFSRFHYDDVKLTFCREKKRCSWTP